MPAKRRRRQTSRIPYREVIARLEALCRKLDAFNEQMAAEGAERERELRAQLRDSEAKRIAFVKDMCECGVLKPDDPQTKRLLEPRLGL